MSRDARKKQKQRLKREQKRLQAKRVRALTPLDHIARSGGQLECYVNANWREMGMANIQVLGRAPDGRLLASGCSDSTTLVWEAKRLVAGGVRFARQNGFKLPPHYERWTAIFGDLGDLAAVDLTDFGVEGGLRYVGTKAFLQRRLAACTVDEFLNRPDVQWVLGDGTPRHLAEGDYSVDLGDDDDDEGDDDEDDAALEPEGAAADLLADLKRMVGNTGNQMEDAVRKWCFQTGQAPHPRLREALNTLLVSVLPVAIHSKVAAENPSAADDMEVPYPGEMIEMGLDTLPAKERHSVKEAMDQVSAFLGQFKSPAQMLASVTVIPSTAPGRTRSGPRP